MYRVLPAHTAFLVYKRPATYYIAAELFKFCADFTGCSFVALLVFESVVDVFAMGAVVVESFFAHGDER